MPSKRHHPLRPRGRAQAAGRPQRRGLSHLGGPAVLAGDERLAADLAHALDTGRDDGRSFTHGFHAYPARMHPLTARRVIAARLGADEPPVVVDPFCGSGSVAVEAVRAGAAFAGGDISPIALSIAWVRTRVWPAPRCHDVEQAAREVADAAEDLADENRPRPAWVAREASWYDAAALRDVWALRDVIDTVSDADLKRVLRMVLSSILVRVSKQASDATTVRDRFHRPVRRGDALRLFALRGRELARQLMALAADLANRGITPTEPQFRLADARKTPLAPPETATLVLSSPPYLGTYDYLLHHARRYAALGESTRFADQCEIGARRRARDDPGGAIDTYERDMRAALGLIRDALRAHGCAVLLLGDGMLSDRIVQADQVIRRLAPCAGLSVAAIATQRRPNWLTDAGAPTRAEHLIELHRTT